MKPSDDYMKFFGSFFPSLDISAILGAASITGRVLGSFKQGLLDGGFSEEQATRIVSALLATLIREIRLIAQASLLSAPETPQAPPK